MTEETLEEAEYAHILSAQTMPQAEVETLSDRSKLKKVSCTQTFPGPSGQACQSLVSDKS